MKYNDTSMVNKEIFSFLVSLPNVTHFQKFMTVLNLSNVF